MILIPYLSEAACSQFDIHLASLLGLLFEIVQHINRFRTCGQINYAIGPGRVPHTNLFHPGPTVFIGFQFSGSRPRCTKSKLKPASRRASSGNAFKSSWLVPTNSSGLRVTSTVKVYKYLYSYT